MSALRWTSGSTTHVGNVRERNEDALLESVELGVWAVADGLGGHARGDEASLLLVQQLGQAPRASMGLDARVQALAEAATKVNERLRTDVRDADVRSGSTLVALVVEAGGQAACLWVGDSRAYLLRGGRLERISLDHVSDDGDRALTRAIGADAALEIDVRSLQMRGGDQVLLCSDGLYLEVEEATIHATLASAQSARAASRQLVQLARSGACEDNVSSIVIRFEALG
ncbi:MAG: PP2C family serine/threonine-protein phosphatase [Pseudomonadota bacterium]